MDGRWISFPTNQRTNPRGQCQR